MITEIREHITKEWNWQRVTTTKGSTLRYYLSSFQSCLETRRIVLDYWASQFRTGHGGFCGKLHSLGKDIDPLCPSCRLSEMAEHVIVNSTAFNGLRARLLRKTGLLENYRYFKDCLFDGSLNYLGS